MKNTILSLVIAIQTSICLASSKDENSLSQSSSHATVGQYSPFAPRPPLIDGTFPEQRLNFIQNMFNKTVEDKKFDMIIPQLGLLDEFGDRINKPAVLVNLFIEIKKTHHDKDGAYKLLDGIITVIKVIPQEIINLTREYMQYYYASGSWLTQFRDPSDDAISFFERVLTDSFTAIDFYYMGRICERNENAHHKSIQFLEKYFQQCADTECSDKKMLAAFTLHRLQGSNLKTNYFVQLNISPDALIEWMKTKFKLLNEDEKHLAYYAYNYVIENHKVLCRPEEYLKRDYFFWITKDDKHDCLIIQNKEVINLIVQIFKDLPISSLEESYIDLSRKYSTDRDTQQLGLYALLCLKEYKTANRLNVLQTLFQIHEYHTKYLERKDSSDSAIESEKENLFQTALETYSNQHSSNTAEDSFRLGRMAYKILRRKEQWNITATAANIDSSSSKGGGQLKKYCMYANQYFVKALQQDSSHSLDSQIYYYLCLTKSQLGQLDEANEYMENARFWNEGEQDKKIVKLKSKAAQGAFSKNDYGEAIKHIRDIESSHGKLSGIDAMIKCICFEKFGYTYNIQKELEGFNPEIEQIEYIDTLFRSKVKERDDEAICVLYNTMKCLDWKIEESRITGYIEAEKRRQNFAVVCQEAEKFLQGSDRPTNHPTLMRLYPPLIVGLANTHQKEKFVHYLKTYIDQSERKHDNSSEEQSNKKHLFVATLTSVLLQDVRDYDLTSEYVLDIVKMLNASTLSLHPDSCIYMASIFSASNLHKEAIACLLKSVTFDDTKGIKFTCDFELDDNGFKRAHTFLNTFYPYICNSLICLNMESSVKALMRYLKTKHKIILKEGKNRAKSSKKSNKIDVNTVYKHLISSYLSQAKDDHLSVASRLKEFSAIGETEGQYVKSIDVPVIIKQATEHCALIQQKLGLIKSISSSSKATPDEIEKARQARDQVTLFTNEIKALVKSPLYLLEQERKKRLNREQVQLKYGLHQEDFLNTSSNQGGVSRQVALRLQQLHQQQKEALVQQKQQPRQAQRQDLQKEYEKAQEKDQDDNTVTIPPETTLITCAVLPTTQDAYTDQHHLILWQIISHKFNLNPEDQETLRVILTRGERSFQISLKDIKSLFAKFEGHTSSVHHGGSHEQVSGMGLTLMPNADGIKKGSYYGQIGEAREKIISIIAKTLTYKDLIDAS